MRPKISVLLPIYNGQRFLKKALASLFNQSLEEIEIIAVDDASQDDSLAVLKSIKEKRLRVFHHQKNQGLAKTINHAARKAKAPLLARMDQDDLSYPERLEKQYAYMLKHKLDLVGSWYEDIDDQGQVVKKVCRLTAHQDLKKALLVNTYFCHGSLLFNKDVWEKVGGYNKEFDYAEDYDFISRVALLKGVRFGNVAKILYQHGVNPYGMSLSRQKYQEKTREKISKRNFRRWQDYYHWGFIGKSEEEKPYQKEVADRLAKEFIKRGLVHLSLVEYFFPG